MQMTKVVGRLAGPRRRRWSTTILVAAGLLVAGTPAEAARKAEARGADLSLESWQWPSSRIAVGEDVTFNLRVSNAGPSTATSVKVTTTISGPATVDQAWSSGVCTGTSPVVCPVDDLAPGQIASVSLRVRATAPGTITSTAQVVAAQRDPSSWDNTATGTIEAIPGADVAVTSAATGGGPAGAITHTVTNEGPDDAPDVSVLVRASGAAAVSATQGLCFPNYSTHSWTCELGALPDGQGARLAVVVSAQSVAYEDPTFGGIGGTSGFGLEYGPSWSYAEAGSTHPDPDRQNNVAGSGMSGSTFSPSVTPCTLPGVRGLCWPY